MMPALFNEKFDVYRRRSDARDALNNPTYGHPVDGEGWRLVYLAMPSRLALTDKGIEFSRGGERALPNGTLYIPATYDVQLEDRVVTAGTPTVTFVVTGVKVAYKTSKTISHYELTISLP
jgi:hypothetical protein